VSLYDTIRFARDTAYNWASVNPIMAEGEPGYEKDTGKLKIGNGLSRWNDLDYLAGSAPIGGSDEALQAHIDSVAPHPVYDDGPSLLLLYTNAKV
jgi:hypothetical protein